MGGVGESLRLWPNFVTLNGAVGSAFKGFLVTMYLTSNWGCWGRLHGAAG